VDHIVIPLDGDHVGALRHLRRRVGAPPGDEGHVTVVSFEGVDRGVALDTLRRATTAVAPFAVRAHGYGLFVGDAGELSLHVPVVRNDALNTLHRAVVSSLRDAGASIAGWTEPPVWSPHVTIVSGSLTAEELAVAVHALAEHAHPSWHLPVRHLELVPGRCDPAAGLPPLVLLSG
jgi:2'-5' RNA ligase